MVFELQGRAFRPGDIVRSLLLMCGGYFNEFYLSAQKMPIAQLLYLFEAWVELREQMNPKQSSPFKDVEYR